MRGSYLVRTACVLCVVAARVRRTCRCSADSSVEPTGVLRTLRMCVGINSTYVIKRFDNKISIHHLAAQ